MMTLDNCPVTLEEFKAAQRFPPEAMDFELENCLLAAAEWCSNWLGMGDNFQFSDAESWDSETMPSPLKRAIIMQAGFFFRNPADSVYSRNTMVITILAQYRRTTA